MRKLGILALQPTALTLYSQVRAQKYQVPRMPGAELLERSNSPNRPLLATEEKTTGIGTALMRATSD
jgi:hypothetical protein